MEVYSHAEIAALENTNWWYATRRDLLASLLKRFAKHGETALDVGCGVGSNYPVIAAHASRVIGLDISAEALENLHGTYNEKVLASVEEMPIPDAFVDIVVCADVLEHVDDTKAVRDIHRILKPGGLVFVTVPAGMSLWNENDDYGHHLRRYRKSELRSVFADNNFDIRYLYNWNRLFFVPVWLVARFYKRDSTKTELKNNLTAIPAWLNPFLIWYMKVENALARYLPLPFGVSLVLVARKK